MSYATSMSSPVRTIPVWLSLLVILLCLGGGGAFVWWYMNGAGFTSRTIIIPREQLEKERAERRTETQPRRQQGPRVAVRATDADGIKPDGGNSTDANATNRWTIKSGDASAVVRKAGTRAATFRYSYVRDDLLGPDQFQTMVATWRLARDQAMATAVGLSDEQVSKLRAEAAPIGILISDDDRKKIDDLFNTYLAATTDDARASVDKKTVAALGEIGKRQLDPTKQQLAERVTRIRAILTEEQWAKWKKVGG